MQVPQLSSLPMQAPIPFQANGAPVIRTLISLLLKVDNELRPALYAAIKDIIPMYSSDMTRLGREIIRLAKEIIGPELTQSVVQEFVAERHVQEFVAERHVQEFVAERQRVAGRQRVLQEFVAERQRVAEHREGAAPAERAKRRRVELDVECPVCFSQFRSTGDSVPKVNACGHTLCVGCIGALPSPKKCPECRAPIKMPAALLPTNFALFGATAQLP
jgi:hypothetical protein